MTCFSASAYGTLLGDIADLGYRIHPMNQADVPLPSPRMILRHDVDLSLDLAVAMAELEAGRGLTATYFILPHNDYYNPLAPAGRRQLRHLVGLGHEIGLHWDSSLYPAEPGQLTNHFQRDVALLADIVGQEIVSASQHIPIDSPHFDVTRLIRFEAYSGRIARDFTYVSDSAMAWRQQTPLDLARKGVDIQFLAHPIWWMMEGDALGTKLANLAAHNARQQARILDDLGTYMRDCLRNRSRLDRDFATRRTNSQDRDEATAPNG